MGKNPTYEELEKRVKELEKEAAERRKAEEALRESEAEYRRLFTTSPDGVAIISLDGRILDANQAYQDMLGYTLEELKNLTYQQLTPKRWHKMEAKAIKSGLKKGFEKYEKEYIKKDGTEFPVFMSGWVIYDDQGNPEKLGAFVRDISERKQAQEVLQRAHDELEQRVEERTAELVKTNKALQESEERYKLLFENSGSAISYYDTEGRVVLLNRQGAKNLRGEAKDFIGKSIYELFPEVADFHMQRFTEIMKEGKAGRFEDAFELLGAKRWFSSDIQPVKDESGNVRGVQIISDDITDHKQAEEALRESEEKYRLLVENATDAIFIAQDEVVKFPNPKTKEMIGYSEEELAKIAFVDLIHPEDRAMVLERHKRRLKGEHPPSTYAFRVINRDGGERWAQLNTVVISWEGRPATLNFLRDITEQRRLETQLLQAQKMEAIGTLAGGIAHDFNNLLVGFLANISLAKRSAEEGEKDKTLKRLQEAEDATSLAKDLTQRLLTFAKGGKPITKLISIAELISETTIFALSGSNVRCDFAIPDDLWAVEVDRGQMSQVIQNLVLNADEAMPDGGEIKVMARNISVTKRSTLPLSKGNYVEVIIEDKGVGIPKEHLDRIFDPYFSTKQKGSGLGLATAYSIIKNHGGHITVDSKLGVGTTFSIYLRATKERIPKRKQEVKQPPSLGIKRILVMDDSEIVRRSLSDSIQYIGYEAEFAHEGSEAVELYTQAKDSGQPFDAVLLDLTVPGGMGGKETIERLLKIDPNVKAIVTSGFSTDPVMANYKMYGFSDVLVKPYGIEELEKLLFQILTETKRE